MLFVMSSSCSKDNSLKLPEEKIESSELVQTLESVNNNFMANKQEVRGKGWKKKFLRVLGVAAADIGGGYEIGQKVMNLFLKIYSNYPQNQTDINDIINKYVSIIEPSTELSKEEKELICSSLSVAAYSFKYWETTLP